MLRSAPLIALAVSLAACGGSTPSTPNTATHPSTVFRSAAVGPSAQCPTGGIEVTAGIDQNGNGLLDAGEVQSTQTICNGAAGVAGQRSLVRATPETAGLHCPAGGLRLDTGLDADGSGALTDPEVTATSYVCNGVSAAVQVPVAVPLLLAPSAPPLGDAILTAAFGGSLVANDVLLADGTRADFLAVTVGSAGTLALDADTSQGRAGYYLFTDGCLSEPDVSHWGPCALGALGALRVAAGRYILLTKQVGTALPWEEVPYGARARLFVDGHAAVGSIATAYGMGGLASFLATADSTLSTRDVQISLDSAGRVLAGWYDEMYSKVAHVARLTTSGQLDTTFAGTGVASYAYTNTEYFEYTSTARPVESIGGTVVAVVTRSYLPFAWRLLPDGSPDPAFGISGVADLPPDVERAHAVASLPDGSLLIAATINAPGTSGGQRQLTVLKLTPAGALDPSFGVGGRVDLHVAYHCWPWSLQVSGDGAILAYGSVYDPTNTMLHGFVARLASDGQPDANFGTSGVVTIPQEVKAVRPLPLGKVLIATVGVPPDPGLRTFVETQWLAATGSLDASPGGSGIQVAEAPDGVFVGFDFDLMERLLLVVKVGSAPGGWKLCRFLTTGELDPSFGDRGVVSLSVASAGDMPGIMAQGVDGSIYVAGADGAAQTVQVQKVR